MLRLQMKIEKILDLQYTKREQYSYLGVSSDEFIQCDVS